MKLYEVTRGSKIRVLEKGVVPPVAPEIDEGEGLVFHHVDGMYSLCTNKDNEIVHLAAWTEVEVVE